jgi:hypothetical protein
MKRRVLSNIIPLLLFLAGLLLLYRGVWALGNQEMEAPLFAISGFLCILCCFVSKERCDNSETILIEPPIQAVIVEDAIIKEPDVDENESDVDEKESGEDEKESDEDKVPSYYEVV